ncbi:MAG TPA: hypothetical protein VK569_04685, partial [Bacteroidota bacterium]|nr:hypothetical protein [Bacteroidota bacterium]
MIIPRFEKTGRAEGKIFIGEECVAEIAAMSLFNLRLGPGGARIIGPDVPLPLFWRQYAHHEDPRRNGGSMAEVNQAGEEDGALQLRCEGTNAGAEIISIFTVGFSEDARSGGYRVDIHGLLEAAPGKRWSVTYNPSHGELEFCNMWPEGTFRPRGRKSYTACFHQRGDRVTLIPHTHLESSDKHNILMRRGDRFGWLLEEENPVIEVLSEGEVHGGLCAYMWDAHLGYRACSGPGTSFLDAGSRREASFRISRIGRAEGQSIMTRGARADAGEASRTPLYVEGVNTFRESLTSFPGQEHTAWPWTFEVVAGNAEVTRGDLDGERGFDDTRSLRITSQGPGTGCWMATTLGPAFGGPPFAPGKRYRLSAVASSESLRGITRAGLRLHREGTPGLGDTQAYESYW